MKALTAVVAVLATSLGVLNMLGGIVSGVWLAVLGEWGVIGWGILAFVASNLVLSIALVPSIAIAMGLSKTIERRSVVGSLFLSTLSSLYVAAVMTAWAVAVMVFFMSRADARSWLPMLLWSYGVAIGPWAYMAHKESSSEDRGLASRVAVFFAEIGYVALMLVVAFAQAPTPLLLAAVFGALMLVDVILQSLIAGEAWRQVTAQSDPWQEV